MGYPVYPEYKESGIQWLGEIPTHWNVWKVTHGFETIGSGTTPKSDNPIYFDGEVPWVTTSELRESTILDTSKKVTSEALIDYPTLKKYPAGSVAIAMYGATIGRLGILGTAATVNQACCVFSAPTIFDVRFFYYWLWMRRPILISLSNGGGQPNLSQDDLKKLRVPTPDVCEQQTIARFLDHKTAQIDALIAKKEALLQKLAEKRTALISQAVTQGLDPTVPMQDSGVAWLGKIPAHWKVKRQRFLIGMNSGMTPHTGTPEFWDGNIPWVSPKDMKVEWISGSIDTLTEEALAKTAIQTFASGHVLIVVRGMILAHSFPVAINKLPVTINQDMKAISTTLEPAYLAILLRGMKDIILSLVEEAAHGTKVMRTDLFKNIRLPVPPSAEQKAIVDAVKLVVDRTDLMVKRVNSAIDKLKEYRAALITAAVTGQIDVRGVPLPAEVSP